MNRTTGAAREREVFLAALDCAPGARAGFLASACGGDGALRSRVEELLAEQEEAGGFLERPAIEPPRSTIQLDEPGTLMVSVTERPGDWIGRYKLLQKIGEGGCGVVYMAEQEEPVRRRVALKVIKLGMDTKSVIARFEAERQALAMMEHPNIARVFDAGATETGRPYFVMELVRGVRITAYCDENNLSTEERLKLFVQVCHAIQHAHQKGIIHRDIKPSNILVTLHDGVPVPKVIDFGIAKATEQRLTEKTLFTEFTAFIGTPAYMSPEQAEMSGLDIDTRSDVYALGVLLYELLTGKTPFDAETLFRAGLDECRRTIREKEPARPSTKLATMQGAELTATASRRRTDVPKLIHSLRGDLDWIVMKALEKDRSRRYATANDLAEDVRRFLEGDTVLARPPSNIYRLRKLLRRHRVVVSAAAMIALTLIVGITVSTWQAIRATRLERNESHLRQAAERESASARLNEYVADINLAQQSLAAGNYGRAVQLLNKHRPGAGDRDLRGFEWRYLWQQTRGDPHVSFPSQEEPVQAVALSPNGELLAVGSERKLNIWNTRTRALAMTQARGAGSLRFLPDGKSLVVANVGMMRGPGGGGIRVLNVEDWSELRTLSRSSGSIAMSRDGSRLALVAREGVRIWRTSDWEELQTVEELSGPITLSANGTRLAADSTNGIVVWPLEGGAEPVLLEDSANLVVRTPWSRSDRAMAFSPDGKFIVAACNTLSRRGVFVMSVWDARTGKEIGTVPENAEHVTEHTGGITSLAFSPDGRTLVSASMDYSIRLWDFQERQRIATLQGNLSEVWAMALSADGQTIVTGGKDGSVKLWPAQPPQAEEEWTGARLPIGFSADSRRLAALSRTNSVLLLNMDTRETEWEIPVGAEGNLRHALGDLRIVFPSSVAVSADLKTLATSSPEDGVQVWNTTTRELIKLNLPEAHSRAIALSPNGRLLLTTGWGRVLRWWDVATRTNVAVEADADRLLFSADGRTLAALGRGGDVELWNVASRSLHTVFTVEPAPTQVGSGSPLTFSPDGKLLAIACQDDTVQLWNVDSAQRIATLTGHKQAVQSVAFAPDGKTLATASDDSTLKFWNVATQQELLTIRRLGGGLRALTFSPDGRTLVAGISSTIRTGGLRVFRAPSFAEAEIGQN